MLESRSIHHNESPQTLSSELSIPTSKFAKFILSSLQNWETCPAIDDCCSCFLSLCDDSETIHRLFSEDIQLIFDTFQKLKEKTPSSVVLNTLAKISLFPYLRIAFNSLIAIHAITNRDHDAFSLIEDPIFPDSPPASPFYDIRMLLSDIPKFLSLTNEEYNFYTRALFFCSYGWELLVFELDRRSSTVDLETGSSIISHVKEVIGSNQEQLLVIHKIADSLPTSAINSPPHNKDVVGGSSSQTVSEENNLTKLKKELIDVIWPAWKVLANLTFDYAIGLRPHLHSILADNPKLETVVLRSVEEGDIELIQLTFSSIISLLTIAPENRTRLQSGNLVEKLFSSFDFQSVPLSKAEFHAFTVKFIRHMLAVDGATEEIKQAQFPSLRVSVYNHVWKYLSHVITHSPALTLNEIHRELHEDDVSLCYRHIFFMEVAADELDEAFLLEQAKWEVRWLTEVENEKTLDLRIFTCGNRAYRWRTEKWGRLKRRERMLRKEGWDDALETRVVGLHPEVSEDLRSKVLAFGILALFNLESA
ncbi:hypothetical protein BLNAU_14201 [Blattamonas nauphoetae]|uniref:Uncharacterized protein n=1 Tax=Blattamonas nauphoetae TaxID=2049346 RepID=A0ABQ9XGU3_9EUKA|nr:hypothetical protein BLNAU_14201 [Blattamonas nauphoetae]